MTQYQINTLYRPIDTGRRYLCYLKKQRNYKTLQKLMLKRNCKIYNNFVKFSLFSSLETLLLVKQTSKKSHYYLIIAIKQLLSSR